MSAKKIMLFIGSLNTGGAEVQAIALARGLRELGYDLSVALLYSHGTLSEELRDCEIKIHLLNKKGRFDLRPLWRFVRLVRHERPDILLSYLGVANIMSSVMKHLLRPTRVVCGLRSSKRAMDAYDRFSRTVFKLEKWAVRFADLSIANSYAGRDYHVEEGVSADRMAVVQNGIDTSKYFPDPALRERQRNEWGVGAEERLIGLVARMEPVKGYETFIRAAALLSKHEKNIRFVCVGGGAASYSNRLENLSRSEGLQNKMIWAGAQKNMQSVYNALDVAISASLCEGFSNAIGEAMSCGIPCIVTDVGDSSRLVGDNGIVVPARDPDALAAALFSMLSLSDRNRGDIGLRARKRIVDNFGMKRMIQDTEKCLGKLFCDCC